MKNKKNNFDELIKDIVREGIRNSPPPPEPLAWEDLRQRLKKERSKKRKFKVLDYFKFW